MMSHQLSICLIILITNTNAISKYVECINVAGDHPSSLDTKSTATCPSTHILTSCGAKPIRIGNYNDEIFGSSIQNDNSCVSWTDYNHGWLLDGIRAYARCCALTEYGSSFIKTYDSTLSGTEDDETVSISCAQPNDKLIGCTGITTGGLWDGSFVDVQYGNTCHSQNGAGGSGGSYAIARCYDNTLINDGYELQCMSVWGQQSSTTSTASCPSSRYFMTSCSGFSPWSSIGQYMIENDICTVTHLTAGDYSVANAVCCTLTKPTSDPTMDPTLNPTINPSTNPTLEPTLESINPSKNPTFVPTYYPSFAPTVNTNSPSITPSVSPTKTPTFNPTMNPTVNPTPTPTFKLIITPPTMSPKIVSITSTYDIDTSHTTNQQNVLIQKSEGLNLVSILAIAFGILLLCACSIWIIVCVRQRKKFVGATDNIVFGNDFIRQRIERKNNIIEMEEIESKTNVVNDGFDETGTSIKDTDNTENNEFVIDDIDIDIITPGTMENDNYITNGNDTDEIITGSDNDQTYPGTEGDTDDTDNINNEDDDDDDILNQINSQTIQ